jgi:hypothetical protein
MSGPRRARGLERRHRRETRTAGGVNAPALVAGFEAGSTGGFGRLSREEIDSLMRRWARRRQLVDSGPKLWHIGLGQVADVPVLERTAGGVFNHVANGTFRGRCYPASCHQEFIPQLIQAAAAR